MKQSMTRWLAPLLLGLALTAQAQDDEERVNSLDEVRSKGVLRVAVYKDNFPYSYLEGGRMQGLDVDIAQALAERLGLGMSTMNVTPSDESMGDDLRNAVWKGHYLGGGTADVMMHVPVDPAFAEENDQVTIFGPYYQEQLAVAHDPQVVAEVNGLMSLAGQKIAVELETMSDMFLSSAERGRFRESAVRFRHYQEACQALQDGQVPVLMAPQAQLEACLGDNEQGFAVTPMVLRGLFSWTVGLATKADRVELTEALEQAMTELKSDGTLEQIFSQRGLTWLAPKQGS